MIEKLEIMMRSVASGSGFGHTDSDWSGSMAEPSVSIIDVANKLNEIIDYLNTKESNAAK